MSGPGPVLKEAHRLRRYIHDLDCRIASAPKQMQIQKAKLQLAEDNLKKAQDEIKQLKVKNLERESSIKSTYTQIVKWEKQRETAEKAKEIEALTHEIDQGRQRISAQEDEAFETITVIEEKTAQLPGIEAITKQVRAEVAQFEKDYDERVAKFVAERGKAVEELKTVDAQLPDDIKVTYTRLVANRGPDALSGIENRTCTACYTELIPQNVMELNRGAFVLCKSCGRMLYV